MLLGKRVFKAGLDGRGFGLEGTGLGDEIQSFYLILLSVFEEFILMKYGGLEVSKF